MGEARRWRVDRNRGGTGRGGGRRGWLSFWGALAVAVGLSLLWRSPTRARPEPRQPVELSVLHARVASLEAEVVGLDQRAGRLGDPATLERLSATDDWREAVEQGILRAVVRAQTGLSPRREATLAAAIVREAHRQALDPLLVTAVVAVESGFRPSAHSRVGAMGLMQVMPRTAAEVSGSDDPLDAAELRDLDLNLKLGCRYLAKLIRASPSLPAALVAYNMGPTSAKAALGSPRARELLAGYPRRVLRHYDALVRAAEPKALASAAPAEWNGSANH